MKSRNLLLVLTALTAAPPVFAQKTTENAVTAADDAFGTTVGVETIGIYSEFDTRGFSPTKAGNARLDGIYFDSASFLSPRIRAGSAIRVGFAALDYPFPAPTGIIDTKLRGAGDKLIISPSIMIGNYGSFIQDVDAQIPLVKNHLSVAIGLAHSTPIQVDGTRQENTIVAVKPVIRFSSFEFSPFYATIITRNAQAHALAVTSGPTLPSVPPSGLLLGQTWAGGDYDGVTMGATLKMQLGEGLSLRSGYFRSSTLRIHNYTELYALNTAGTNSTHIILSDPRQNTSSRSWESQLGWNQAKGDWQHRIILGVRGRDRHTETGGSFRQVFTGTIPYGLPDVRPLPNPVFSALNIGKIHQISVMASYLVKLKGVGQVNIGLQKTNYRAQQTVASGLVTQTKSAPWLYNASAQFELTPHLSLFAGTVKGLEDSGIAPESAANRNEQLAATLTTQYDGGLRIKGAKSQFVLSAFQIEKPFYGFDPGNRFALVGTVRHRGIEASWSGKIGKHLQLLAGGLVMQPRVSGPGVLAGTLGSRSPGVARSTFRIDANYRTALFGGLTPTLSFVSIGKRAVSSAPFAALAGQQTTLPVFNSLDLGVRNTFKIGKVPVSARFVVANVFDQASWKVIAANTLQPDDRRRASLVIAADF